MPRLFLKELPFWVTKEMLISKFSRFGLISDVKIIKNISREKKNIGFIGFIDKNSCKEAVLNSKFIFLGNKRILIDFALPKKNQPLCRGDKNLNCPLIEKENYLGKNFSGKEIFENGIIFIRNLCLSIKKTEIENLLRPFGFINTIFLSRKNSKNKHSFAIIEFGIPECAIKAASKLDGKIFQGKILHILPFNSNLGSERSVNRNNLTFTKFKKMREDLEDRSYANRRSSSYLFIPKEKLIKSLMLKNGNKTNYVKFSLTPRLGHGKLVLTEARIQNEMSLILKYMGLSMKSFDPNYINKKSRRILFLKAEKENQFSGKKNFLKKFGKIKKFISFSITNFTLVEYQKKKNAQTAFNYFQKKKNKKQKILIDWAPLNCLPDNNSVREKALVPIKEKLSNENLIFFRKKKIQHDNTEKRSSKNQQNKDQFGGKYFSLNDIQKNKKNFKFDQNFDKSHKILIRNLPFEIDLCQLKYIYQNYGTILSIKLPKENFGKHKGFAFVEFKDLEEAKKAVLSTQNIHLHSRHLVVNLLQTKNLRPFLNE